ncbi:alpha/beta hydrolase [Streptomyces sp. NPDC047002]|uniref:alpha/beta fold hydrolase n=1 Tax=Streptomyces sp. NPDC047002 TaxID=3155475 RepID=UPI003453443B
MTTYLLVHGAFHSGECWRRTATLLRAAGHRVHTPSLTGYGDLAHLLGPEVGLDTHVDDIVRLVEAEDLTGVVLVGHSYAGLVVSAVAERVPGRIARLVFLDAMVPKDGESAAEALPLSRAMIDAALRSESGWRVPPPRELPPPDGLFGVTDPADLAWLRAMLSDHPVRCLQQPVRLTDPAAAAIERTHIHCTALPKGFVRPPVPRLQPNGNPARIRELPTGHDCMITMPRELADLLLELA